jgi:ArsR family transcriptional regulator
MQDPKLETQAELLRALAHPTRLCIVKGLMENGPRNVSQMQSCSGLPQPSISQHLSRLRAAGIVEGERRGLEVVYRLVSEDTKRVLTALFGN